MHRQMEEMHFHGNRNLIWMFKAFEKYNVADVLAFQVKGIERKFKDYSNKARRVSFMDMIVILLVWHHIIIFSL